ncbi:hypothetical protein RRG08_064507 [Elysia crispata]|uniref:Secreted protein n=1 Tax=Elysia crispata TaxID=231223 RepID=A0AAE1AEA1_9GAST|nr:hypothetical protein RRG08_064507 [Elysia crispata]
MTPGAARLTWTVDILLVQSSVTTAECVNIVRRWRANTEPRCHSALNQLRWCNRTQVLALCGVTGVQCSFLWVKICSRTPEKRNQIDRGEQQQRCNSCIRSGH